MLKSSEALPDPALAEPPGSGADRQVHGTFGATVGTGGARSLGGTAAIPLGRTGSATILSFENSRFDDRPYR